uniref:BTB domain-containing protein n=1 Tax=Panagrolaimus davidi TaxID=227884 RepID=A0A914QST4_9BILA
MESIESSSLKEAFENLFETKKCSDITFVVHGKELQAHKIVLLTRSTVFEAMFNSNLKTNDGKHLIEDPEITYEDFENFLKFLYTDCCKLDEGNIKKMLHLNKCIEEIEKWLNVGNILKYAEIGLLYEETCSLLDSCLLKLPKYIFNQPLKYFSEKQWVLISPELTLKIAEKCPRDKNFTEDRLFKKIFEWAKYYYSHPQFYKTVLNPIMPFIKFEKLDPITLATTVYNNKLLSAEEYSEAISKAVTSKENSVSTDFVYMKVHPLFRE